MNVEEYLERLAVQRPAAADEASLVALHRAHLLAVPFENLDIHLGRRSSHQPIHQDRLATGTPEVSRVQNARACAVDEQHVGVESGMIGEVRCDRKRPHREGGSGAVRVEPLREDGS